MGKKGSVKVSVKREELAPVRERRPDLVQFELNLEDAPIFASQARKLDRGTVEYVEQYRTGDGRVGEKKWRLKPSDDYGDLDVFDQDVYMAINSLIQTRGGMPADGKVSFTIYELVRILDLPENGQNYSRVRESILRISKTLIDAENAFYKKEKLSYESEHFIIWRVHFEANADKYGRAAERHTLRFDEVLIRSHRAGYIKQLDVNFYLSLDGTHAKSLYRRVDYKRQDGLTWTIGLKPLKELLGMAPSYRYPSKIKEKLASAHQELIHKGFLASVNYPDKNTVVYEVSRDFLSARVNLERPWTHEENRAIRALIRNGVWSNVAPKLVADYGPERCSFYVRALPYQKGIRAPGAWLRRAIEQNMDVALPEDHQPRLPNDPSAEQDSSAADSEKVRFDLFTGTSTSAETNAHNTVNTPVVDPVALDIWESTLTAVSDQVGSPSSTVWFEGTVPIGISEKALTIAVPNVVACDYITERFKDDLETALKDTELGEGASLQIVVAGAAMGSVGEGIGE